MSLSSDPLTVSYVNSGQNGICSESKREPTHAINLATTTLVDHQTQQTLFVGVRHGIHSASGLTGLARTTANQNRAAEAVTAALLSNQAVLQQALTNARPGGNGQAVDLDIVSLSLVTPTYDLLGGESALWKDQLAAWNHINANSPHTIQVWDPGAPPHIAAQLRNVTINVQVVPMNWGVNPGAITYGVGWSDVQQTNRAGLIHLLGELNDPIGGLAGNFLAGGASAQDKQIVRELVEQIRDIWTAGTYKSDADNDIYKMTSRLALLAHKIGATPMWNCKSGKDRTGHLDAEAKFLAAEIRSLGHVPPYGRLSVPRRNQFKGVRPAFRKSRDSALQHRPGGLQDVQHGGER